MGYSPWGHKESDTTKRLKNNTAPHPIKAHQAKLLASGFAPSSSRLCWRPMKPTSIDLGGRVRRPEVFAIELLPGGNAPISSSHPLS